MKVKVWEEFNKKEKNFFSHPVYKKVFEKLVQHEPITEHVPSNKRKIEKIIRDLGFTKYTIDTNSVRHIKGKYLHIGCNVQFGHQTFFLKDMVYFQHLFNKGEISEVLYICAGKYLFEGNKSKASNLIFENSKEDLEIFKKIFTIPVVFYYIESWSNKYD